MSSRRSYDKTHVVDVGLMVTLYCSFNTILTDRDQQPRIWLSATLFSSNFGKSLLDAYAYILSVFHDKSDICDDEN